MISITCNDMRSLQMLSSILSLYLNRIPLKLRPYLPKWDHSVRLEMAVLEIQKMWRGFKLRRLSLPRVIMILIKTRAIKRLQRWYRWYFGLHSRMKMLHRMNILKKGVNSSRLYIDAWTFYNLIRIQYIPNVSYTASSYPEFNGYPYIDNNGFGRWDKLLP